MKTEKGVVSTAFLKMGINATQRSFLFKTTSISIAIACVLFLNSCNPKDDTGQDPNVELKIYWRVELVGKDVRPTISETPFRSFYRLFDDGTITALRYDETQHVFPMVRSTQGVWSKIPIPSAHPISQITWYADKNNYAGYSTSPGYGWAYVDGKAHKYYGPPGIIRGKIPGGALFFDSNIGGYLFLQSWKLGPADGFEELDIHNYMYEDMTKRRYVAKVADDGTTLLLSSTYDGSSTGPAVVKGNKLLFSSNTSNFLTSGDSIFIQNIDRTTGRVVGASLHQPAIIDGKKIEYLGPVNRIGIAYATNSMNDALYVVATDKDPSALRLRWHGTTYAFDWNDWQEPSQTVVNGHNMPEILDMDASGRILFVGSPQGSETGTRLYLATPSLQPEAVIKFANLKFKLTSTSGEAPADILLTGPANIQGNYSKSNLSLTVAAPSSVTGKGRAITVLLNLNGGIELNPGVAFTLPPGGGSLMTITYYDGGKNVTAICNSGSLKVDGVNENSFSVHFDALKFKTTTNYLFEMSGDVVVQ